MAMHAQARLAFSSARQREQEVHDAGISDGERLGARLAPWLLRPGCHD